MLVEEKIEYELTVNDGLNILLLSILDGCDVFHKTCIWPDSS